MELNDNERSTIVRMEMEKAHRTFADMEFFEANEEKITPYIEPTRQLIEKICEFVNGRTSS